MVDDATLEGLERSLAALMRLLADRGTVGDVARRSGYDLPPASWSLLEHLDARGALRVSDIAACHGVDISSVTPRLKRLEAAGLVARGRVPTDARAFLISITEEGVHALESVHAARRAILEQAVVGIDGSHLSITADVLSVLTQRLASEPVTIGQRP
ncbi:MarR family transcriptional regulator [Nocardioides sp. dk4132]|uniref:MarR family winged helix-turn-helix transcriptional regulator n=1 Tax=unclassified Nocardioides TaxID=2615069 RepID=UPI001296714E|nr:MULTISPECIES: MarR family transcriptional regulator [unclassified Nocardioides]MQW76307.1 MarR family transcriptional regulator [Nocardioides sp. dk4132]QGA07410.1 MarR family transcriptional regulator [Nocardioides sp. dk884]